MWYMETQGAKGRLLDAAIEYFATHGTADVSLRALAAALGTSHRMLIYHFGSREGLLLEVVRAVEAAQLDALARLEPAQGLAACLYASWLRMSDPALAPFERLYFEVYTAALQGRVWAKPLLETAFEPTAQPLAALLEARGMPAETARVESRLAVGVIRGVLLDLLATGDRACADAAIRRFFARYDEEASGTPTT